MIDTKKVRLMTKIAVYEEGIGREDLRINKSSLRTYMGVQMIKSFLCLSAACGLLLLLYSFRYLSSISNPVAAFNLRGFVVRAAVFCAMVLSVGMIMSWRYHRKRYRDMLIRMKNYDRDLSRLSRYIEGEGKK